MNRHAEKTAVSPGAVLAQRRAGKAPPQLVDKRNQFAKLKQLQATADGSTSSARLNAVQLLASAQPSLVVQRAVVRSAVYSTASTNRNPTQIAAINQALTALDAQVPTAEARAVTDLRRASGARNASSESYIRAQTPARWGYCVERQLNSLAQGWHLQHSLASSRPDYHMRKGGTDLYADLTTVAQAGAAGDHVTGKLGASSIDPRTAVGADITYSQPMPTIALPGAAAAPAAANVVVLKLHPVWRQAPIRARQRHQFARGGFSRNADSEYNAWAMNNRVPSHVQILKMNKTSCQNYAKKVRRNLG